MEVDDFFDGIKRLYNEDATAAVQEAASTPSGGGGGCCSSNNSSSGGEGLGVCSVLSSRQEGSSSPCPPLQPAGAP